MKTKVDKDFCLNYNVFKWSDNCCYIDAVLVALLIHDSHFILNHILTSNLKKRYTESDTEFDIRKIIQFQILKLSLIMRNKIQTDKLTCNLLRKYIKLYPTEDKFHEPEYNDASDFLKYILDIFDIHKAKVKTIYYHSEYDYPIIKIKEETKYESIVFENEELPYLDKNKEYSIRYFFNSKQVQQFNKDNSIITKKRLINTPYIIFRINRYYDDNIFYKIRIIPNSYIKLNKEKLVLVSVVVFEDDHYTCYFKCSDKWYYYDDASRKYIIKSVGNYDKLLKHKPSVSQNGVLYFYDKEK